MKRKTIALTLASVMAASLLAGCGSGSGSASSTTAAAGDSTTAAAAESTTAAAAASSEAGGDKIVLNLCWWGNQVRNDVTKQAVDLYMSENPNIQINIEFTDWSGYWDKLSAMAAGGNLPDIIQQDYSYINQYQKSNQLADLTPYLEDGTIDTTNIPESIIESGSIDGKCYALSLGSNAPIMTYDKAVIEEAGVTIPDQLTIEEMYDIGKTIYEKTGVKTYFDGGLNMAQIVARTQDHHLFDELAEGDATSSKVHFDYVKQFAEAEFTISPDLLAEKNPDVVETKPIVDGTTWNDFSYSNQYIALSDACGRDLGITMYPTTEAATTQPMFLKPSQFFSIAETSQHKDEAAKFIGWFTNSVECNKILMGERGIPINTEVADAIKPDVDAKSQEIFDYISAVGEVATPIDDPDPAGKGEVEALLKTIVEDVRYGDKDAQQATDEFVPESQRIMAEAAQ